MILRRDMVTQRLDGGIEQFHRDDEEEDADQGQTLPPVVRDEHAYGQGDKQDDAFLPQRQFMTKAMSKPGGGIEERFDDSVHDRAPMPWQRV